MKKEIPQMTLAQLNTYVEERRSKMSKEDREAVQARRQELKGVPKNTAPKVAKEVAPKAAPKAKKPAVAKTTLAEIAATLPPEPTTHAATLDPELTTLKATLPGAITALEKAELPESSIDKDVTLDVQQPEIENTLSTDTIPDATLSTEGTLAAQPPVLPKQADVLPLVSPQAKNVQRTLLPEEMKRAAYAMMCNLRLDRVSYGAIDLDDNHDLFDLDIEIGDTFTDRDGKVQFGLWASAEKGVGNLTDYGEQVCYRKQPLHFPFDCVGFDLAQARNYRAMQKGAHPDQLPYQPAAFFVLRECWCIDASFREHEISTVRTEVRDRAVDRQLRHAA